MQRAIAITRQVKAAVPRHSQVTYASMQHYSINAIAEDASKASAAAKRKQFLSHSHLCNISVNPVSPDIFFLIPNLRCLFDLCI